MIYTSEARYSGRRKRTYYICVRGTPVFTSPTRKKAERLLARLRFHKRYADPSRVT